MNHSLLSVVIGTLAFAAPVLTASNALASATCQTSEGTVTISDTSSCHFELSGGCKANCTPVNFTHTCDVKCTASATTTCSDTCKKSCETECTKSPSTFSCKDNCTSGCVSGCQSKCNGSDCSSDAEAYCDNQCTQSCVEHPGTTECSTECDESCNASCTVQENIECDETCTNTLTGGCTAKCSTPTGGLFCDGQFIDISDVTDCDFSITVEASGTVTSNGSAKCSMTPGSTAPSDLPAGLAVIAGLGLVFASRRRSRDTK